MQAAGRGDDFSQWYAAEAPRATAAVTAAIGDPALAEECVAEAFARAYARWPRVSRMQSRNGWIYVVALNQARTAMRRTARDRVWRARATRPEPHQPPDAPSPVWDAVRALSPLARRTIALRYIADLSEAEVARALGVSRGTVATTLHRARRALAAQLELQEQEAPQ